jgi:Secretion system C-terminal sorting domain
MRNKILFNLLFLGGLTLSLITLESYSTGYTSTTGCSCHGNNNAATVIAITGFPSAGYVPGTAYTFTATVTNSTEVAAGLALSASAGTLDTITGQGTKLGFFGSLQNIITHSSPKAMTVGTASFDFTWTAPAAGTVNFNMAGNAVNLAGDQESGDVPNAGTFTLEQALASSASNLNKLQNVVSPNPSTGIFNITALSSNAKVVLYNSGGELQQVNVNTVGKNTCLDACKLSAGMYFLKVTNGDKQTCTTIVKQ